MLSSQPFLKSPFLGFRSSFKNAIFVDFFKKKLFLAVLDIYTGPRSHLDSMVGLNMDTPGWSQGLGSTWGESPGGLGISDRNSNHGTGSQQNSTVDSPLSAVNVHKKLKKFFAHFWKKAKKMAFSKGKMSELNGFF